MIHIKIISPGKNKDAWLEDALQEYLKRLSNLAHFDLIWTRDEKAFQKALQEDIIYLDPHGKMMTSAAFAAYFFKTVEAQGSHIAFAIAGPEGFPEEILKGRQTLSLSQMTFTHQMARLILVEQIFRAFEIKRGSPYHK